MSHLGRAVSCRFTQFRSVFCGLALVCAPLVLGGEVGAQPPSATAASKPEVFERVLRQDGRWNLPVEVTAREVVLPVVEGGALAAVLDGRERLVVPWHEGYVVDAAGEWTLQIQGPPGARVRVSLTRTVVARVGEAGDFSLAVAANGLQVIRQRLRPGAYRFACDVRGYGVAIDVRDAAAVGAPRFRWLGSLIKNARRRQWMLVERDFTAEIAVRNRADGIRACRGELCRVERPIGCDQVHMGQVGIGDGALHELQLRRGDLVRILVNSAAFDAQFDLWDSGGVVSTFDDAVAADFGARHTFVVPEDGTYRVLVYSRAGAGSGSFILRVDRARLPELISLARSEAR